MDSEKKISEIVRKYPAPYVPFSTFETGLDKLAALPTLPPKIDHTVFPSMGGVAKGQVIGAFKFFKLIDADGIPDPTLKELAKNKEGRKAAMLQLIKASYPNISENDLAGSSPGQLDAKLGDKIYNISGDTKLKARSFLIKAAEFAGLPISTLLKAKGRQGPRQKRNKTATPRGGGDVGGKSAKSNTDEITPPIDPANVRMPIALSPERVIYIEMPKDLPPKDAKKLLALLGLSLDVSVQFPEGG
jgi:hypothetical protein